MLLAPRLSPCRRSLVIDAPYSVAGLAADFDANDLAASLSDTDPVTTWADATGNSNDIGNTGTNRPTFDAANPRFNDHASVNFAAASTQYLFGSSLPICTTLSGTDKRWTAFVVYRRSTKVTAQETFLSLGKSDSAVNYQQGRWVYANSNSQRPGASLRDGDGAADSGFQGQNEIVDLAAQIAIVTRGASAMTHHVIGGSQNPRFDATVDAITATSGAAYGTQATFTHDRLALGALVRSTVSSPCDMEVARVLVYTRELTDAERATVAEYLWDRYCARPYFAPAADLPTELADGLIHHWRFGAGGASLAGLPQGSFNDAIGGKHFTQATEANQPIVVAHNGWGAMRFDGSDDVMTAGVAADWTFLHDGSDCSVFVVYRVQSSASALTPILDNVDNDTTNETGIGLYHDAASAAHSLQLKIGATNATPVVNHDAQDYAARPDAWHIAHFTCEASHPSSEEDYQVWIDNENYAALDEGVTPDSGDSGNVLTLGALAGGGTFGAVDVAEILIFDRKMGRPGESQRIHEFLARKWNTSHVAVAAGNGQAGILDENDATPHRGFPGLLWTAGRWICCYRRATTHGSSAGVCCMTTSGDGLRWTREEVIFDDSSNYDWRGVNFLGSISTGRVFLGMALSETDSDLLPYTSGLLYSDDGGNSWSGPLFLSQSDDTWFDGLGDDTGLDYDEGVNALVELADGTLLALFMARVTGIVAGATHILACRSTDGGTTWSRPTVVWWGASTGNGGDFDANYRIQESCLAEFADGELLAAIRCDTPSEYIYFARSTDGGVTWTPSPFTTGDRVDGWGNPRMVVDPNDGDGVFLFHRLNTSPNLAVWRYSDDRGVTWSDPQPVTNLNDNATTTLPDFGTGMTYAYPALDGDGNVWVAWGMELSNDGDVFVRRWADVES